MLGISIPRRKPSVGLRPTRKTGPRPRLGPKNPELGNRNFDAPQTRLGTRKDRPHFPEGDFLSAAGEGRGIRHQSAPPPHGESKTDPPLPGIVPAYHSPQIPDSPGGLPRFRKRHPRLGTSIPAPVAGLQLTSAVRQKFGFSRAV
jgi:hypothetical protein